jgi:hypothetical protein
VTGKARARAIISADDGDGDDGDGDDIVCLLVGVPLRLLLLPRSRKLFQFFLQEHHYTILCPDSLVFWCGTFEIKIYNLQSYK